MYIHNLDPTLLHIGPVEIRYYGLVYVMGFLLVYFLYKKFSKDWSLSADNAEELVIWCFLGMIIGARLFHFIITEPFTLLRNPLEFFMVWHGGMAFFGALAGYTTGAFLFSRFRKQIPFLRVADLSVLIAIFCLAIGRIANFINAELVGRITTVSWCVVFPYDVGCRHPYQLYASATHFLLFIILLFLWKFKSDSSRIKKGTVFFSFLTGYGLLRFLTDFFREEPLFWGLTAWQYFTIILFIIGISFLFKTINRKD